MTPSIRRFIIVGTPFGIFLAATLVWVLFLKPVVLNFLQAQIPRVNTLQTAVRVEVTQLDISLIRLQLIARDSKLTVLDESLGLSPIQIGTITAQIDFFDLLIGQPSIAKVTIENLTFKAPLKNEKEEKPLPDIPIENIFRLARDIPIDHVVVLNSVVTLEQTNKLLIQIGVQRVTLSNLENLLFLKISQLAATMITPDKNTLQSTVQLDLSASPERLSLRNLKFGLIDSKLEGEADFRNYKKLLSKPEGQVTLEGIVNLQDIRSAALSLFPSRERLPAVSGQVNLEGTWDISGTDNINGDLSLKTSQVVVDHFKLGQAELTTTVNKNQILINEINLEHPAGLAQISNIRIEQKSPFRFSSRIKLTDFDVRKLFVSLNLNDIPVGFQLNGTAQCEGSIKPSLQTGCNIEAAIRDVWVKSHLGDSNSIISFKDAQFKGQTQLTEEKMTYATDIKLGQSSMGTSQGEVNFEKGFDIQFDSPNLDFKDITSLAGLDLKGAIKINGKTSGDSKQGVIDAKVSATQAEIDKFKLGVFAADLAYKNGELKFLNLDSSPGRSKLKGQLVFNFEKSTIGGELTSTEFHGEDLITILGQRFNLPFNLTGQGSLRTTFQGPFDFWDLTYSLEAQLKNGMLANERFETLTAQLESDGQRVNFKNVRLNKPKSVIIAEGQIKTETKEPLFDIHLKASPLQLEESDHVLQYAPSIAGSGYADGQVTGPIQAPTLQANLTLQQVTYDKVEYPNSQGSLTIDKDFLKFNGQFFGRQIQTDVKWPWDKENDMAVKVLVQELNPLFLLPLISVPQPSSDFNSSLTAEVDLSSKTRSFANADGFIRISQFFLSRGNQMLKLTQPSRMIFKNGLNNMEDVRLSGEGSRVRVHMDSANSSRTRLDIEADLQLKMFHFLVPFAQNLGGEFFVDSQLIFKKGGGFELFGEGELTDGLVALKGLPQVIENISTPIEFSKSKIFLSDITGKFGPSDVTGVGTIDIIGSKNIAVNLRAIADNVQLTFPDKVYTEGNAQILFSGNWLPYDLKIDYKVNQGLIENNFEPDPKQSQTLKASSYLPPTNAQLLTPSLALDVNVDISNGILIRNKILEGEAKGLLQIQGTPEQPIIIGKIAIEPGSKLIFKDKPFEIQNATVQFQGTRDINPDIYIVANSRVSDYDINLLVQGLAKNLTITPTSQPPLSQNDIFTLLALGVTNQGNQNLSSETQQRQTGLEVLAAISNQSQLNKRIQEKLGLTVQLAPAVDSTKNIAVPKVVVSKKISKKVNASYAKPFTGNDQNQEVRLQYLYNNNVSLQLNYQNKETTQQELITDPANTNRSIFGLDLEYRDEFK